MDMMWVDKDRTILQIDLDQEFNRDAYNEVVQRREQLTHDLDRPIAMIYDVRNLQVVPQNLIGMFPELSKQRYQNTEVTVIVGASRIIQDIGEIFSQRIQTLTFVSTLAEAEQAIWNFRMRSDQESPSEAN